MIPKRQPSHADRGSRITIACPKCFSSATSAKEAEKVCSCCGEHKARIGEDAARVLHSVPAHFELHIHILPKYACPHCRDGVIPSPEPPPRPISGCIAGPGLLSELIISKFAEHLTLYQFEDISTRYAFIYHAARSVTGTARLLICSSRFTSFKSNWCFRETCSGPMTHRCATWADESTGSHVRRSRRCFSRDVLPYDVYDFTENGKPRRPRRFPEGLRGIPARRRLQRV